MQDDIMQGILEVTSDVILQTFSVDKKNQLDIQFFILDFSSNSCSTCFGQPCVNHQELQPRHIPTQGYNITQSSAPDDGHMVARNMLSNY